MRRLANTKQKGKPLFWQGGFYLGGCRGVGGGGGTFNQGVGGGPTNGVGLSRQNLLALYFSTIGGNLEGKRGNL